MIAHHSHNTFFVYCSVQNVNTHTKRLFSFEKTIVTSAFGNESYFQNISLLVLFMQTCFIIQVRVEDVLLYY